MDKKEFVLGFLLGIFVAFFGAFIFIFFAFKLNLFAHFDYIKQQGILGKVITLGCLLNIIVFFVLLKFKKDFMARGIILSLIVLAIYTLFIK